MKVEISAAIIGGTGLGTLLYELPCQKMTIRTKFGLAHGRVIQHNSKNVLVFQRHSKGHKSPPHSVHYQALAATCKHFNVKKCFATAAVGSLLPNLAPGDFGNCKDFIDLSSRNLTVFPFQVKHADMSFPFSEDSFIQKAASSLGVQIYNVAYLNVNGPRYESWAEINAYRTLGADVVGMTAASEAIAMKELQVPYECLAIITNFAAGMPGPNSKANSASHLQLDHADVTNVMRKSGETALKLIFKAIDLLPESGSLK